MHTSPRDRIAECIIMPFTAHVRCSTNIRNGSGAAVVGYSPWRSDSIHTPGVTIESRMSAPQSNIT